MNVHNDIANLTTQRDNLERVVADLSEEIKVLQDLNAELLEWQEDDSDQLANLNREIAGLRKELDVQYNVHEALSDSLEERREENERLFEQVLSLQDGLEDKYLDVNTLLKERESLAAENATLRNTLGVLNDRNWRLSKSLSKVSADVDRLREQQARASFKAPTERHTL